MPEQVPPTQGTPLQPSSNSLTPSQAALSRSRSIFPKGRNFTLDDFSSRDFIVKDFIESLSDSAVFPNRRSAPNTPATNNGAPSATGNIAFDPKPLIRSFEAAQRRLEDLSGDLELRENELSAATRRAEAQHTGNTETLGRKLHETILAFTRLDTSLNGSLGSSSSGGNAAVEIGSRLEELERQRRRAMDAHFLIQCWDEVSNKGSLTLLEGMRRTGAADDKVRSAHIAKQLLRISQRLDPRSWGGGGSPGAGPSPSPMQNAFTFEQEDASGNGRNTREIIEKFAETLETDLLRQFDDCYRKANLDGMKDCATVLYDFNGGASVIAAFVNQHPFFIDSSQLVNEEVGGDAETWEQLADPDADPPGVEPSLQSLVDDVKVTVQDESTLYIRRAFPFYENVLAKFLQRVFQQSIQQRLELVLDKADSVSSLAFLRSLQAARSCINVLVDDLKAHGLTEHPDTISPSTAAILDQQLEELFVPYFSGNSYIEREKRNLEELYTSLMFKFATFHMRRKQTPKTFLTSLAKSGSELIASAKESYMSRLESSDFTPTQRAMLMRVAGLKNSSTDSPDPSGSKPEEIQLTEEDGQLSIAYAKRMLKWLAEGVGRSLELSGGAETARDVSSLLTMLLSLMGEQYIEAALDAASDAAMAQESSSKTAPAFAYLLHLRPAIAVTHLMRKCIETVLIPLAAGSPTVKREMEKRARAATGRIEERINSIQQRSIDVALAWVARCLAGQKKNDFRPREDSADGGAAYLGLLQTPVRLLSSLLLITHE